MSASTPVPNHPSIAHGSVLVIFFALTARYSLGGRRERRRSLLVSLVYIRCALLCPSFSSALFQAMANQHYAQVSWAATKIQKPMLQKGHRRDDSGCACKKKEQNE